MANETKQISELASFVYRACDVLHLAAAILRDREMPQAASALAEQAIMLAEGASAMEKSS